MVTKLYSVCVYDVKGRSYDENSTSKPHVLLSLAFSLSRNCLNRLNERVALLFKQISHISIYLPQLSMDYSIKPLNVKLTTQMFKEHH